MRPAGLETAARKTAGPGRRTSPSARARTFSKAITLTSPSQSRPVNSSSYPSVDAAGNVYLGYESDPVNGKGPSSVFVTRSTDDGVNWGPFVRAATFTVNRLPNTTFRLGIPESFAASPTYPGHLYVAYENWNGTDMDVMFTQSTDGGQTWSTPVKVNDNVDAPGQPTDQFQPEVAAGLNGAVAGAFYDRRQACPNDPSVLSQDAGQVNFCIDTSLQAYKDSGAPRCRSAATSVSLTSRGTRSSQGSLSAD